jgi:hypothetical protein
MVRIVGILCGSALAISFLIIVLGVPEILPEPEAVTDATASSQVLVENIAPVEPEAQPVNEPISEPADDPVVSPAIADAVEPVSPEPEVLPPATPLRWYAFWSPFRSEMAANGFVSQLQRTTGMDYRVVRLKPGVYEVAFAYEADNDIENKLAAISAATGLEMPDG